MPVSAHPAPATLDEYVLAGAPDSEQLANIEQHLLGCRVCRERIRDEKDSIDTLKLTLLMDEDEDTQYDC